MRTILFVCVHNAGRSVMAEALFNQAAGGRAVGVSAGTVPQEAPHPEVVDAMRELDLDVSNHRGRLLTDDLVRSAERVITMGCAVDAETCPAVLYANVEDWGLDDPKGQDPGTVRRIRDEIRTRVTELLREL
jgi:arsenate reductase